MSTQYPPFPYRRLKMMANGLWDEAKRAFYPFKLSNVTVPAKTGIRYYVKHILVSAVNYGDAGAVSTGWSLMVGGTTLYIFAVVPATVAASNVSSGSSVSVDVNILCDANSALAHNSAATLNHRAVIYAEIPDDLEWIVVE